MIWFYKPYIKLPYLPYLSKILGLSLLVVVIYFWEDGSYIYISVELFAMLTYFSSEMFWSTVSLYADNACMWSLNIPNKSYLHDDNDRISYRHKRSIISGGVGIKNLGDGTKSQKRNIKWKDFPKLQLFF